MDLNRIAFVYLYQASEAKSGFVSEVFSTLLDSALGKINGVDSYGKFIFHLAVACSRPEEAHIAPRRGMDFTLKDSQG